MNVLNAIYQFLVGDKIILSGILLIVALLLLINEVSVFAALRGWSGIIMIVGTLVVLGLTLSQELFAHKKQG